MAFSGSISQTVFNTGKVMDSAFRRCKMPAQTITSEHLDIAKNELYLLLSTWANDGAPLWCIEKQIYPLYEGVSAVVTAIGTVDVLNANLRTLQALVGATSTTATEHSVAFDSSAQVATVGVRWAAASAPLALETSADGLSWTTIQTETPVATAGQWSWFDLTTVAPALFFRVRATSGVLSAQEVYLGNMPTEVPFARLNRDDYTTLPNKTFLSDSPLQYWFDRQARQPVMYLWPVPSARASYKQIVLWRHRHIMDVGSLTQEVEVPQRWYDAVVAGLAARLSNEVVEVDAAMIPALEGKAAAALYQARQEEYDNSPIRIMPNISAYTA